MAGQASACAGVGAAKRSLNHPATAGWKEADVIIEFFDRSRLDAGVL
jgi:hypothetical protein